MGVIQPPQGALQTRFDGGEISPRLAGRFDSELYKKALRKCNNFEPLPQGSLRMRSGSQKVQNLTGDSRTRLIPVRLSTGQDYIIELLDKIAHLYSLTGSVVALESVGVSELVSNGDFSLPNGQYWSALLHTGGGWGGVYGYDSIDPARGGSMFVDANGVQRGFAIIQRKPGSESPVLYQQIIVQAAANVSIKYDQQRYGCNCKIKISTTPPSAWADQNGGGDTYSFEPALWPFYGNQPDPTLITQNLGPVALGIGTYYVSFQITQQDGSSVVIDNVSLKITYTTPITDIPTPWSANEAQDVRFATETGRDRTLFVHPKYSPWFLLFGGQAGNWKFGSVVFTSLPVSWGDTGSTNVPVGWNWQGQTTKLAASNWPAAVDMHDGRVYYAGEPAQKNRILGSKSGLSDDFTTGANPGDALDFKIATKGAIQWLRSQRVMLAGTDLGQHSISGSKGTPLVADIQARQESAYPASNVQAVAVGIQALYVSADLRRIRAATFNFMTNGWESKDITFAAEHVTADLIKELHLAWTPECLLISVLKSGKIAICTFEPVEQVTAWWAVDVGAAVCSAAVSQGPLGAYLWMAVLRGGKVYLERLNLSESTEVLRYTDSSISAVSDVNGNVAGLDHLEGSKVTATAGGAYVGSFLVTGGTIQLGPDYANTAVVAGLSYLATAITLPKDTRYGKAQSSKIGAVLNNSALPKFNGKRPAERTPKTPMDTVEPLYTGKQRIGSLGWDDEDVITITQDLPLRTEICAIFTDTQVETGF